MGSKRKLKELEKELESRFKQELANEEERYDHSRMKDKQIKSIR